MSGAGELDRVVQIEYAPISADVRGPSGHTVKTFSLLRKVAAKKKDLSGDEAIRAQQLAAKASTVFEIGYPLGLSPIPSPSDRIRLVCEGRIYDVTHVEEIGRRVRLRILAWARAEVAAA